MTISRDGLDELLTRVSAAFEGDLDAVRLVFDDDAVFRDRPGEDVLEGLDEVEGHFAAFGGLRERFDVHEALVDGDHVAFRFTLSFRADADAYAHLGGVFLTLREGRIVRWEGMWLEGPGDLSRWAD